MTDHEPEAPTPVPNQTADPDIIALLKQFQTETLRYQNAPDYQKPSATVVAQKIEEHLKRLIRTPEANPIIGTPQNQIHGYKPGGLDASPETEDLDLFAKEIFVGQWDLSAAQDAASRIWDRADTLSARSPYFPERETQREGYYRRARRILTLVRQLTSENSTQGKSDPIARTLAEDPSELAFLLWLTEGDNYPQDAPDPRQYWQNILSPSVRHRYKEWSQRIRQQVIHLPADPSPSEAQRKPNESYPSGTEAPYSPPTSQEPR